MFKKIESVNKVYVDNLGSTIDDNLKLGVITKAKNGTICEQNKAYDELNTDELNAIENENEIEYLRNVVNMFKHGSNFKIESVHLTNNQLNENKKAVAKVFSFDKQTVKYESEHVIELLANMDLDYLDDNKHYFNLYDWFNIDSNELRLQSNLQNISKDILKVFKLSELPEDDKIQLFESGINGFDGIQMEFGSYFIKIYQYYNGKSIVQAGITDKNIINKLIHYNEYSIFDENNLVDQLSQAKKMLEKVVK